jgi:hypothetical protein
MTEYYVYGDEATLAYRIVFQFGDPPVLVELPFFLTGNPMFMDMNGWDCCKDSNAGTPAAGSKKMNELLPHLFPSTSITEWATNWHDNLLNNFKTYTTTFSIKEEEIVFERNKKEVKKLDQCFFFNESGLGATKVADDENEMFEIDTGAQHVDEGPGNGNPEYSFPKSGDTLIFDESFFRLLGFPTLIKQWKCTTNATGQGTNKYTYEIRLTDGSIITDPQELLVSNGYKNTMISNESCAIKKCLLLILFKELGDVMQTATYLIFIKLIEYLQQQIAKQAALAPELIEKLLPISRNELFNQCLQSRNINYSAIMLTCDNTVHIRDIKLGIPSCFTGSHVEEPYTHATQTGRIYYPITDIIEKLKSLLNMEYKRIESNNTTITTRLTKAHTTKKLIYIQRSSRGKEIEQDIPDTFNTTTIKEHIDSLTRMAEVAKQRIQDFITQNDAQLRADPNANEYVKNVILGIPNADIVALHGDIVALHGINGFKEFMCPPIITPVPPKPNLTDPQSITNRKLMRLSLVSLQIPPGSADHTTLFEIIKSELIAVSIDLSRMLGGGKSKQKGGTKEFKKTINLITNIQDGGKSKQRGGTKEFEKTRILVTKFSASEKFLIYILINFLSQETQISDYMEKLEYIFSMYNICIYMLEYYKNIIPIISADLNISDISDPKYAYFRLHRVLNILATTFGYNKTLLDQAIATGIDSAQSEILTLETGIDTYFNDDVNNEVLAYFYYMFEFIDDDDEFIDDDDEFIDDDDRHIPIMENDAYVWDHCTHKYDPLTGKLIQGSGIYHPKGNICIATSSIISWLSQSYPYPITDLPDSAFIDPFTRLQYKQDVIHKIKSDYVTSNTQYITTRSHSHTYKGGKYSHLSKQFITNKNKKLNKKLAPKTRKYKSRKYKSRKYKSRKYKSRKHKSH